MSLPSSHYPSQMPMYKGLKAREGESMLLPSPSRFWEQSLTSFIIRRKKHEWNVKTHDFNTKNLQTTKKTLPLQLENSSHWQHKKHTMKHHYPSHQACLKWPSMRRLDRMSRQREGKNKKREGDGRDIDPPSRVFSPLYIGIWDG